jgi:hypothetical protein
MSTKHTFHNLLTDSTFCYFFKAGGDNAWVCFRKKRGQISLFANDRILFLKDSKDSTKNLLDLTTLLAK